MESLTTWLAKPFNQDQSAFKWFLFIGLIVVALLLWGQILKDIREVV
jgi:hypothetical protein